MGSTIGDPDAGVEDHAQVARHAAPRFVVRWERRG
jgi:hypothetical protein